MMLELIGSDVDVVHDGAAALECFTANRPTVVLLDIGMPGMNGYEVARRMRDIDPTRSTMIIALTGWGQEEDRRRSRDSGIDHHLTKPADIGLLKSLLAGADKTGNAGSRTPRAAAEVPPSAEGSAGV